MVLFIFADCEAAGTCLCDVYAGSDEASTSSSAGARTQRGGQPGKEEARLQR